MFGLVFSVGLMGIPNALGGPADSDGDGIDDGVEISVSLTDPFDDDTDDDGLYDGNEFFTLFTDPLVFDSDNDGLGDGLELGFDVPEGIDTDPTVFVPDSDGGATVTDPLDPDTDGDGLADGVEDANQNGRVDAGETDPNVDDADSDGDGFSVGAGDCDDSDPLINPGETEVCDGVDNNCDGSIDEGVTITFFIDEDGDGYGDPSDPGVQACGNPGGFSENNADCDDTDFSVNPGMTEIIGDGIDNNCNGIVDEGAIDSDGDGFTSDVDCDDSDASINPGATEFCDGVDNDCNGQIDETDPSIGNLCDGADSDLCEEGITICVAGSLECSDTSGDNLEVCDGQDNDCNSIIDDGGVCGGSCGDGVCDPIAGENTSTCPADCTTTGTGQASGNVEILSTCGLAFVAGNPVNYGQVFPGAISDPEQLLVVDNTGNTVATLLVQGGNWVDGGGVVLMTVGDTHYSTTALQSYAAKTALTGADVVVTSTFDPVINQDTYWQLQANLLNNNFAGDLTQTMDFTVTC